MAAISPKNENSQKYTFKGHGDLWRAENLRKGPSFYALQASTAAILEALEQF